MRRLLSPQLFNKGPVIKANSLGEMTYSGTHTITRTVTAHDLENRSILEESFEESVNQHQKALSDKTEVEQITDSKK